MTVVVFPVPGGPWIIATSGRDIANRTALCWLGSSSGLMKECVGELLSSLVVVGDHFESGGEGGASLNNTLAR